MPTLNWIGKDAGRNVLTGPVFDVLSKFIGPKVIYAAVREGITFKPTHGTPEV